MAITNKIENFRMEVNPAFLAKAEALAPALIETEIRPAGTVELVPQGEDFAARPLERGFVRSRPLGRGGRPLPGFRGPLGGLCVLYPHPGGQPPRRPRPPPAEVRRNPL